jgi:hypothetical protein
MHHNDRGRVFAPSPFSKSFSANDDSISATSQTKMMSVPQVLHSAVEIPFAKCASAIGKVDTQTVA